MKARTATIERVLGGGFPRYNGEEPEVYWEQTERQAERLRRAGVTHVGINDAIVSIPWIMDPENYYLNFTTCMHPMDRYVASTYNLGIYHPSLLAENRKLLLWQARLARKYGFRCCMTSIEITFQPESFYRRHPDLRGPRVDNPACSHTPLFAPCIELPAVQDHYRQLTRKMLELVPELDELQVFTCDSGSGFCYADSLYSGPNGPQHCRSVSPGKHAQTFCRTLLEAGKEINPAFRVVMTSGLSFRERKALLEGAPRDITCTTFGALSWCGGLEDRWANMTIGPAAHTRAGRTAALAWQAADMKARIDALKSAGRPVYTTYSSGNYAGPVDPPKPYQEHEILMKYLGWGVSNVVGGPSGAAYDANGGVFEKAVRRGKMDTSRAVRELAVEWVGEARAGKLCEVWRLSDHADRERPMRPGSGHSLHYALANHPLVPDEGRLGEHDLDYYLTPDMKDMSTMRAHQGGFWRNTHLSDEIKRYLVRQLSEVVIPAMEQALSLLDDMLRDKRMGAGPRACLEEQRRRIGIQCCYFIRERNVFQASFLRCVGSQPCEGLPAMPDIVQAEIENSQRWHTYAGGAGTLDSPRQRLMKLHRDDPVQRVDLTAYPYPEYPGFEGYRIHAAHLADK